MVSKAKKAQRRERQKMRQQQGSAPQENEEEREEIEEIELPEGSTCQHVSQVSAKHVRATLHSPTLFCKACQSQAPTPIRRGKGKRKKARNAPAKVSMPLSVLWVCLHCGNLGCNRERGAHGVKHYETAQGVHALALQLESKGVWCYACDSFVAIHPDHPAHKELRECVEVISSTDLEAKEPQTKPQPSKTNSKPLNLPSTGQVPTRLLHDQIERTRHNMGSGRRGLNNLGNTCFFNSIMQNIVQIKPLRDQLLGVTSDIPEEEGIIAFRLREFMSHMWAESGAVYNPTPLHSAIVRRNPFFRGFRQQDAQELLSTLLDGVRMDEIDRIRKEQKEKGETPPGPAPPVTYIDELFGGDFVSHITCHTCLQVSKTRQVFFELLLPIRGPNGEGDPLRSMANTLALSNKERRKMRQHAQKASPLPMIRHPPSPAKDNQVTDTPSPTEVNPPTEEAAEGEESAQDEGASPTENQDTEQSEHGESEEHDEDSPPSDQPDDKEEVSTSNQEEEVKEVEEEKEEETEEEEEGEPEEEEEEEEEESKQEAIQPLQVIDYRSADRSVDSSTFSLMSCLEDFTAMRELSDDNAYNCLHCTRQRIREIRAKLCAADPDYDPDEEIPEDKIKKWVKRSATKQLMLGKLPRVLPIALKRFEQSARGALRKVDVHVSFPRHLDLSSFVYSPENEEAPPSCHYELTGICVHGGSLGGGHYVAYTRSLTKDGEEKWTYFSDSTQHSTSLEEVLQHQAYVLFYSQIPSPDELN